MLHLLIHINDVDRCRQSDCNAMTPLMTFSWNKMGSCDNKCLCTIIMIKIVLF